MLLEGEPTIVALANSWIIINWLVLLTATTRLLVQPCPGLGHLLRPVRGTRRVPGTPVHLGGTPTAHAAQAAGS